MRKDVSIGFVIAAIVIIIAVVLLINKPSATIPISDDGINGGQASIEPVGDGGSNTNADIGNDSDSEIDAVGDIPSDNDETTPVSEREIVISEFIFSPNKVFVPKGTRITWRNVDAVSHTVNSDDSDILLSGTIGKGESFSFTFNEAGTYRYHCQFHPNMKGTIVVE